MAFPVVNRDEIAELGARAFDYCKSDRFEEAGKALLKRLELLKQKKGALELNGDFDGLGYSEVGRKLLEENNA